MQDFLINTLMTLGLVGIPTFAHHFWINRKRKGNERLSWRYSYLRAFRYLVKWFGTLMIIFGLPGLAIVLLSLSGLSVFGDYPLWSVPFLVFYIVAGYLIRKVAAASLNSEKAPR
ncbi:MAG: hypothetical protein GC185_11825 [Alphaproteobacteria bacterium]|nr:hypothetical protein [Alphaproteobacteria bacterium]